MYLQEIADIPVKKNLSKNLPAIGLSHMYYTYNMFHQ